MKKTMAALLGLLMTVAATAQSYPDRPIKIFASTAPGGTMDKLARAVAKHLFERLGQPVIVENKAGAGGTMSAEATALAPPDGYTLTISSAPTIVTTPILEKVRYDPVRDFRPVSLIGWQSYVLLVPATSTATTVQEVISEARAKPGGISYSSAGRGTGGHLSGELFHQAVNVPMLHVPYRSVAAALNDVAGGLVPLTFATTGSSQGIVDAKKLKPIAITGANRSPAYPSLPTMQEAGFAGFEVSTWYGVSVPAKTPPAIVKLLNSEINLLLADRKFQEELAHEGIEVHGGTPEEFVAFQRAETQRWRKILAKAGLAQKN